MCDKWRYFMETRRFTSVYSRFTLGKKIDRKLLFFCSLNKFRLARRNVRWTFGKTFETNGIGHDRSVCEKVKKNLLEKKNRSIKNSFQRIWRHFENWMKKGGLISGTSSDYLLPSECCVMVNVILDCKVQVGKFFFG